MFNMMLTSTFILIGLVYYHGEGTPVDLDKSLAYFLLAAEQNHINAVYDAISRAVVIYINKMGKEGRKYMYEAIYYCRKYIKLSETEKFDEDKKKEITAILSALSSICRVCGKRGEGYKQCSRCTCVYYCGVDCQRKDWKENGHKEECKKLDF